VWQSVLLAAVRIREELNEMEYYVYILSNKFNTTIYTGVTRDLVRRVYEHKHHADPNSFTAKYDITKLVYYESTSDVNAAIEREKQIKGWNRNRKNKLVESKNPSWAELYDSILP
jgi:putative endonuclease